MKRWILLLLSLCCVFAFSGCGKKAAELEKNTTGITISFSKSLEKYGITGSITLPKKPERVVSLTNTPVLTLDALGIKQVAVPDTKVLSWPDSLKDAKRIQTGMRSNIDLESVLALKPDLVIVGYHARDTYGKILEQQKIPVYYVDAGPTVGYDSVKDMTLILVDAFGKDTEAGKQIKQRFADLEKEMADVRKENEGKKVMVMQAMPPRFFLQNENGTVGSMLKLLGFANVVPVQGGSMVTMDQEKSLSYQPDLVVCVSAMAGEQEQKETMEKEFQDHAAYWNHFAAVKNKRILYLPKTFAVSGGLDELDQMQELMQKLAALKAGKV